MRLTFEQRFWSKVNKTDGCWLWTGSKSQHGYGMISFQNRDRVAHRLLWELTNGPIPPGLLVCHHCDNPACVRLDHLFLGTQVDNMQDCARKGRNVSQRHPEKHPRGEQHGSAKLTAQQIIEIRQRYKRGIFGYRQIASEYGIVRSHARSIVIGKCWSQTATLAALGGQGQEVEK